MDFLIGVAVGVGGLYLVQHLTKGKPGGIGPIAQTLQTLLEGLTQIMTQVAQDILGKLDNIEAGLQAKIDAAVSAAVAAKQSELDAEQASHAEDLNAIGAKVDQLAAG